MGTKISMCVIFLVMAGCVGLGRYLWLYRWNLPWWNETLEGYHRKPWWRNALAVSIGVISIVIIDLATTRAAFFSTISTMEDIRNNLIADFFVVMVSWLAIYILNSAYVYCAPKTPSETWSKWSIVSKVIIGEEIIFTVLMTVFIAESNNDMKPLIAMDINPINIIITCLGWIMILGTYIDIGGAWALPYMHKTMLASLETPD